MGSFDMSYKFPFSLSPASSQAMCGKKCSLLGILSLLLQFDRLPYPSACIAGKGKLASFLSLSLLSLRQNQRNDFFFLRGQVVETSRDLDEREILND